MPWIIASQTIPILAIAPMVIVVLASIGVKGLLPKAIISTYLSFFPVTVGMVKGLRSPDPILLDLMRTYNASRAQVFWKLRVPASVPFLFASMKVAIAISLVGAIVGELPTGAAAGIGSRLLIGSYYSQTIQLWSALIAASVLAALLVTIVGLVDRSVTRLMGAEDERTPVADSLSGGVDRARRAGAARLRRRADGHGIAAGDRRRLPGGRGADRDLAAATGS